MKLPNFKRINKNDFPKDMQEAIDKLGFLLNASIEALYTVFNRRASLGDNLLCDVITFTVTVDSTGTPIGNANFSIGNPNMLSVQGIEVIRAVNTTNSKVYPTAGVGVSFSIVNNVSSSSNVTVSLTNVAGIQANNQYQLTMICWG